MIGGFIVVRVGFGRRQCHLAQGDRKANIGGNSSGGVSG